MKNLFSQTEKKDLKDFFVGIIGRPNVGKSTLFNRLIRKRKALVKNHPGVTRDFLLEPANWQGYEFNVVDTGGLDFKKSPKKNSLSKKIRDSFFSSLDYFDFLIFVLDSKTGLFEDEKKILKELRIRKKSFALVINKIDSENQIEELLSEFYTLNENLIPAAFEKKMGIEKIVSSIIHEIQKKSIYKVQNKNSNDFENKKRDERKEKKKNKSPLQNDQTLRSFSLVLAGKPNVGKSSLLNKILGFQRALVSEKEGTTLDCIKSPFELKGFKYTLTDTAGIRAHSKMKNELESLSSFFSKKEIENADIMLLILDITKQEISRQDLRLAKLALENKKVLLLVANKIDQEKDLKLKKGLSSLRKSFREKVKKEFHFFPHVPLIFTSAKTGLGLKNLFLTIEETSRKLNFKISTSSLNALLKTIFLKKPPFLSLRKGPFKFFYSTQTNQIPLSFIVFAKNSKNIPNHYKRFLVKSFQKKLNLSSIPMRFLFKEKT